MLNTGSHERGLSLNGMDGLTERKRRIYLAFLTFVFVVVAPLLVLYASGYRLSDDLSIVRTGGIYVSVPESGAAFLLDGRRVGTGSFFQKNFFVQDLNPGTYDVAVEKDEHWGWEKQLIVYPQRVAQADSFLVSKKPERTAIATTTARTVSGIATTGPAYTDDEAERIFTLFEERTSVKGVLAAPEGATTTMVRETNTGTTSEMVVERSGIGLWRDTTGTLRAHWLREQEEMPFVFCTEMKCKPDLTVHAGEQPALQHFAFHPDNSLLVLLQRTDGIYITELDPRSPRNTSPLYAEAGAKMRVIDGDIVIKHGESLFTLQP